MFHTQDIFLFHFVINVIHVRLIFDSVDDSLFGRETRFLALMMLSLSVTVEKLDGQHCVVIYDMQSGQKLKELNTNNKLTHSDISNDLKLIKENYDK